MIFNLFSKKLKRIRRYSKGTTSRLRTLAIENAYGFLFDRAWLNGVDCLGITSLQVVTAQGLQTASVRPPPARMRFQQAYPPVHNPYLKHAIPHPITVPPATRKQRKSSHLFIRHVHCHHQPTCISRFSSQRSFKSLSY